MEFFLPLSPGEKPDRISFIRQWKQAGFALQAGQSEHPKLDHLGGGTGAAAEYGRVVQHLQDVVLQRVRQHVRSHIVNHLVHAKHREVTLHGDRPLGETTTRCWEIRKGPQITRCPLLSSYVERSQKLALPSILC
ncbi:nonsense-mediated mRNA decay protein 1 [Culex quinquefasciatus]|uniref:Nonsense-mediated mRNA decay protein 1 n=1 Tax=Culex quinquefasciatus TaxID=7176 RepID=B0W1M6_CULQU|nr:nonsense-mediated mRNA decay protein 1 [Culex quinquefasciatus]|eukprot:XP_001842610.1 nonsense-mediated mRNA decay protein 1 [Culex quinquefasciatus]